jgi:PIN domain
MSYSTVAAAGRTMNYDTITIDTSIFHNLGYYLEGGLLAELQQFKHGSVKVVLSEIVYRELLDHLTVGAREAEAALNRGVKLAVQRGLLGSEDAIKLKETSILTIAPEHAADNRLKAFLYATNCEVIRVAETSVARIVDLYFSRSAPFEKSGEKKPEFPDAIALTSLEGWARKHNRKMLAISADKGWLAFQKSESLVVESNLAAALQNFQVGVGEAKKRVDAILLEIKERPESPTGRQFRELLASAVAAMDVAPDASSVVPYHVEDARIEFRDVFIEHDGKFELEVVQISPSHIVANIWIIILAEATATFLFATGSTDESSEMRLTIEENRVTIPASALLTFDVSHDIAKLVEVGFTEVAWPVAFGNLQEIQKDGRRYRMNFGRVVPAELGSTLRHWREHDGPQEQAEKSPNADTEDQ